MSTITSYQPLLDWLFSSDCDDSNYFPKQGALIVYSHLFDKWNISSLLVSQWLTYNVVIFTDFPHEFHSTISSSSNWTELELIPFPLIKYSDLQSVNNTLSNSQVDLVIFDDVRMLSTIAPAIDFTSIIPKVIVLTSLGDSSDDLSLISQLMPNLCLLSLNLFPKDPNLNWNILQIPSSFPPTCLDNKPIDESVLSSVVDATFSNWPHKQIIFTTSDVMQVINTFKLLSLTSSNPYDSEQIYYTSSLHDYSHNLSVHSKFQSNDYGILITNSIPTISLSNIHTIHFIDTCYHKIIHSVMNKCHKRTLRNVYVHASPDISGTLYDHISNSHELYHSLFEQGQTLLFHNGLVVVS